MKRKWDNEKLELLMKIVNRRFPRSPINSVERMKQIIREQEDINGTSVAEHNRQEIQNAVADYIL